LTVLAFECSDKLFVHQNQFILWHDTSDLIIKVLYHTYIPDVNKHIHLR
jgi:hypothetical protein